MRAVDIVLCKSTLCVELMAAFREATADMRYGIMYDSYIHAVD